MRRGEEKREEREERGGRAERTGERGGAKEEQGEEMSRGEEGRRGTDLLDSSLMSASVGGSCHSGTKMMNDSGSALSSNRLCTRHTTRNTMHYIRVLFYIFQNRR